jgi:hypothetical protein
MSASVIDWIATLITQENVTLLYRVYETRWRKSKAAGSILVEQVGTIFPNFYWNLTCDVGKTVILATDSLKIPPSTSRVFWRNPKAQLLDLGNNDNVHSLS